MNESSNLELQNLLDKTPFKYTPGGWGMETKNNKDAKKLASKFQTFFKTYKHGKYIDVEIENEYVSIAGDDNVIIELLKQKDFLNLLK